MAHRNQPAGWLIIFEGVFLLDCGTQLLNAAINLSFRDQKFALYHRSHDTEKRFATVIAQGSFLWDKPGAFDENTLRLACVGRVALRRVCDRAGGMMKCARKPHLVRISFRLGYDFVPKPKAHHYFQRHRDVAFGLQRVFL